MLSAIALFLSLWLATMPVAFMFSMGCCCISNCTGAGSGDCCLSTVPASLDITIPDDFSDDMCSACDTIGGTTYTLAGSTANTDCAGNGTTAVAYNWSYRSSGICTFTDSVCGSNNHDLVIWAKLTCLSGICTLEVDVVVVITPPTGCCCYYTALYILEFSNNTDCDTEVWSVPFRSYFRSNASCDWSCSIAGTPADVSVTKT